MKKSFPILLIALSFFASCARSYPNEVLALEAAAKQRSIYDAAFYAKVEALHFSLNGQTDPEHIYRIQKRLAEEYRYHNFDTAQMYIQQNLDLARNFLDEQAVKESEISLAVCYVDGGFYQEAYSLLINIDTSSLSEELKKKYYYAQILFHREVRNDAPDKARFASNQQETEKYMSLLKPLVDEDCYLGRYLAWEDARNKKDTLAGLSLGPRLVEVAAKGTPEYSEACFFASLTPFDMGDKENDFKWLCKALENDYVISSKNSISAYSVASHFLDRKDIDKAFRYAIEYTLPDAIFYNGKKYFWRLSTTEKAVQIAYQKQRQHRMYLVFAFLITAIIFAISSGILLVIAHSSNKQLQKTQKKLRNANKIKEQCISSFISMISESSSFQRSYSSHVLQMIRQGKTSNLLKEIESLPEEDEEIERLNSLFDSTFLNLFPDFVVQFNSLLKKEEQITPKKEGSLTPEMRICALNYLGMTNSIDVADLLHYSSRTVYNYRVKIKNKVQEQYNTFDSFIDALSKKMEMQ